MLVVIYICASAIPRESCDETSARAVIRERVESVMCGVPSQYSTLLTGAAGVKDGEYVRMRCSMR